MPVDHLRGPARARRQGHDLVDERLVGPEGGEGPGGDLFEVPRDPERPDRLGHGLEFVGGDGQGEQAPEGGHRGDPVGSGGGQRHGQGAAQRTADHVGLFHAEAVEDGQGVGHVPSTVNGPRSADHPWPRRSGRRQGRAGSRAATTASQIRPAVLIGWRNSAGTGPSDPTRAGRARPPNPGAARPDR